MELEMRKKNTATLKTTQSFLRISEIKNDTVVVDSGTLRAIFGSFQYQF